MNKYTIGVDIGGTKCAVILGKGEIPRQSTDTFILDRIQFETRAQRGPEPVIAEIKESIIQMMAQHAITKEHVLGIGISCGGPLDHKKGVIKNPPNLYGWKEIPIVNILKESFEVPVALQNDANACALAEWRFGAAVGKQHVVFLTFGTGMGAGLILNGKLYNGACSYAGEVGHIRLSDYGPVGYGKAGSFEGFCSGGGIAQIARYKVLERLQTGEDVAFCADVNHLDELSALSVAKAAEAGDPLAVEIYEICGRQLGKGLSLIIDIINPEIIVIGSIFERSGNLLIPSALEVIEREALAYSREHCTIVPAKLGDQIGDYAALSVALDN